MVSVIGIGKTKYGVLEEKSLLDLAVEAGKKALEDANLTSDDIDAFYDNVTFVSLNSL